MRCPLCDVSMREVERRGVRIDVCPECRGVWLDRGELEKLLNAEATWYEERDRPARERPRDDWEEDDDRERRYGERRRGWFSEFFEFFD
ncbi:MAG: zf-TFIIB domain-containing protein [Candidatus Bipolaricaulota bacterium]|nr:zf-TFIIB domain-containing protein [Candidatus Bipolaricaulota bacterium]MDW8111478.1 zf-TFIIB domain-containing protein [Candidatus Bipolaricaulota bacterium]MDW8328638.1 zf-TFIIB domain-containing protein [Candidatus Bipolaricaulota bacterium]